MTQQSYNGWTNYETWNFNLWEGDYLQEVVNELREEYGEEELDYGIVENIVKEHINLILEEMENTHGILKDLAGHAFDQIDTHEIIMHLLEI